MAIYITQGRYTSDAVKGMLANPKYRENAVADLMEKARAKRLALYFTFGEYDFLSITEAPSEEVMASALIGGAASGGISHPERFPIRWNHLIEKESLRFNALEHVRIEKVDQLFRNLP